MAIKPTAFENIFITGASLGIGAALSKYYAAPGISLGLISRGKERLEEVAGQCRRKGAVAHTYVADVTAADDLRRCALDFQTRVEFVDLVIANAGIRVEEDTDYQDISASARVMEVNYVGVINTFSPFIPAMKKRRSGHLAVISSIAAFRGTPNSGAYSASKAAINVWTESLRLRLNPYGICVSTLCAGFVRTAMTSSLDFWMPGILNTEEAAAIIASAIRHRKRLVTFPWQSMMIWTFFRMLPGPLYDRLILWAKANQTKEEGDQGRLQ